MKEEKSQRISRMKDNVTWCRPSNGYDGDTATSINLDEYEEIEAIEGELPESDQKFPKGAPTKDHVKVGAKIFKKMR